MSGEEPGSAGTMEAWLDQVRQAMSTGAVVELGEVEQMLVLDLARITAHQSFRKAAPVTAYLVGMALAGLEAGEREARLRELNRALEES